MGAELAMQALSVLQAGVGIEDPQDPSLVTYAAKLERADGLVDFRRRARELHNQIRGLHPWPLASVRLHDRRLRLIESRVRTEGHRLAPGTVIRVEPEEIVVATGDEGLGLRRVQPDGRPAMSVRDYLNGHRVSAGDRFTQDTPPRDE
jgi:methionyl-tRNA formyltransferase